MMTGEEIRVEALKIAATYAGGTHSSQMVCLRAAVFAHYIASSSILGEQSYDQDGRIRAATVDMLRGNRQIRADYKPVMPTKQQMDNWSIQSASEAHGDI